ncbi:hypothetical protein H1R20_g7688, partial [Candolleomyces eurysporus]
MTISVLTPADPNNPTSLGPLPLQQVVAPLAATAYLDEVDEEIATVEALILLNEKMPYNAVVTDSSSVPHTSTFVPPLGAPHSVDGANISTIGYPEAQNATVATPSPSRKAQNPCPKTPPTASAIPASTVARATPVRDACKAAVDTFNSCQDTSTPLKYTTHTLHELESIEEVKKLLFKEFLGNIAEVEISWAKALYSGVARKSRLQGFLRKSPLYRAGQWVELPLVVQRETELYNPFCRIFNVILLEFGLASTREALDTHSMKLKHGSSKPTKHSSSPDIIFKTSGPSFRCPLGNMSVGFSNLASFADGKRNIDVTSDGNHIAQMGVYARQIFIQQPNRRYVRCLIVTEKQARLFHFDRSGVQYTALFDIHKKDGAELLVLLIIGLCSDDE